MPKINMSRIPMLGRLLPRRPRVFALVGKAGSGKSFRARLVAEKYGHELILDDGLLIRGGKILCGVSAKTEATRTAATKVSIFEDDLRCKDIRSTLRLEKPLSILILGISERMIAKIVERLGLQAPEKVYYIEEIATEEQILAARRNRQTRGTHVIPVPVIEVKRTPSGHLADTIRSFLVRHQFIMARQGWIQQSVVNPVYGKNGVLAVSESAMAQMVLHCVQEISRDVLVRKIRLEPLSGSLSMEIWLSLPFERIAPDRLARIQDYVRSQIEGFSGVRISKCHVTVNDLRKQALLPSPDSNHRDDSELPPGAGRAKVGN